VDVHPAIRARALEGERRPGRGRRAALLVDRS
jgi:hypothetical protein